MPDLLVKEMEAIIIDKPREFKMDPRIRFDLSLCDYLSIPCAVREVN